MKEKELEKLQCGRLRFTLQLVNSESHVMRYTARWKETTGLGQHEALEFSFCSN